MHFGKVVITVLATLAAAWLLVTYVGANRMASSAVNVPATQHTGAFAITWTMIAVVVAGVVFWRWARAK